MMLDLNNLPGEPEQLERNANRKFTAREDDGTGLYYYRARYYQPALSRFMSEDPLGMVDGPDLYAYVVDNPVNRTDPSGLKLYKCTTPSDIPGVMHVYLYSDTLSPPFDRCERQGSSPNKNNPARRPGSGPPLPGDRCVELKGADDNLALKIMKCCRDKARTTSFLTHDCQRVVDDCISESGLTPPPSSRFPSVDRQYPVRQCSDYDECG
jgi:RHS repeat-associated protein